jgi:antitoxin (DNA-binding transcriptional repressor) of toxin-antitoxin stability system
MVAKWYTIYMMKEIYGNHKNGVNYMGAMKFLSLRELRTSTGKLPEMLSDDGKIIVTSNGKPTALMIQISEETLEDTLALMNQVKFARAVNDLRLEARQNGTTGMTMEEINEEITAYRKEKRERQTIEDGN